MTNQRIEPERGDGNGAGGPRTVVEEPVVDRRTVVREPAIDRTRSVREPMAPIGMDESRSRTLVPFDKLRWGPIIAGLVAAITLLLVFTVFGLAIGFSVFGTNSSSGAVTSSAGIWSACSAFLAFLLGGWLAGKTAALRHDDNALLNGFMVGASGVVLLLWLTAAGIGNLLGVVGANINTIARIAVNNQGAVSNAANNISASSALSQARNDAWYTFAAIVIGLLAATLGGWLGHHSRHVPDVAD